MNAENLLMKGLIAGLTKEQQEKINVEADRLRAIVKSSDEAALAFALVATELAK
jgi:hypothetical protein